jgi:putative peptidoglycan lipid II flippase
MVLRVPIVQLAFERGKFGMDSVLLTSGPLLFFAAALTALALEIILMRFYFSAQDTLSPAIVGVICVVVHVSLVLALKGTMLHCSIALATAVSKSLKVLILFLLLKRKLGDLRLAENTVFGLKTLAAAAAMALAVHFTHAAMVHVLPVPAHGTKWLAAGLLACRIGVAASAGLVVFGAVALVMRVREARMVWSRAREWVGARLA